MSPFQRQRAGLGWRRRLVGAVLVLAPLLLGCETVTGPWIGLRVAWVDTSAVVVRFPDSAVVGVPFAIPIETLAGGCDGLGPTDVTENRGTVIVTPYTETRLRRNVACPGSLFPIRHFGIVTADRPGVLKILVHGEDYFTHGPIALLDSVVVH